MSDRLDAILRKARHVLTDKQSGRYSDVVLLDHLDDAQKQVVSTTRLLVSTVTAPLVVGTAYYTAPEDCIRLLRITIDGVKVNSSTTDKMDSSGTWEEDTGKDIQAVLVDDNLPFQFRFYPLIEPSDKVTLYTLRYNNLPSSITSIEDKLEIPILFDSLLVHYIVYKALYSNADSANREMATGQFSLYNALLAEVINSNSLNFTPAADTNTNYTNL